MKEPRFRDEAVDRAVSILQPAGFLRVDEVTYRKEQPHTFGMVHFVDDDAGRVMPRLSIGMPAVHSTGVVLSTDLHVLVSPEHFFWYSEEGNNRKNALDRLERDLQELALPWLERHMSVETLAEVFEGRLQTGRSPARSLWQRVVGSPAKKPRRKAPLDLRVLSYCYEFLSRHGDAVDAWRDYLGTMTLAPRPEDSERLRKLEERMRSASGPALAPQER